MATIYFIIKRNSFTEKFPALLACIATDSALTVISYVILKGLLNHGNF